jgi:hypothetical protein
LPDKAIQLLSGVCFYTNLQEENTAYKSGIFFCASFEKRATTIQTNSALPRTGNYSMQN